MTTSLEHELTVLAGLLGQPEPESLAAVEEMASEFPWLQSALPELRQTPLTEWQAEHTRLFVNGIPRTLCPPFESYWRQGSMGGEFVPVIAGLFQRAGVEANPEIPPDYLGSMLDLVVHLRQQPAEHADLLRELWEDHLAVWVPQFAARLVSSTSLALYGMLGSRLRDLFGGSHA
ncbi:MAG: molecular chaperone TorD family protein [Magnetococcus sp. DMHC-1]|nr:molecular chaperone TorD family protein [Magnetococcales bacterium]